MFNFYGLGEARMMKERALEHGMQKT